MLIKVPVQEVLSDESRAIWRRWISDSVGLCAPALIRYEFVSILNQKVRGGFMRVERALSALEFAYQRTLDIVDFEAMHQRAFQLAHDLKLSSTYDAHYLALAEELDCEFWTADERLFNAIRDRFPLIRYVGAPA